MSTTLRILLTASAIISLLAVTAFQQNNIISYQDFIRVQSQKMAIQDEIIKEQDNEIEQLTITNTLLLAELDVIRDSITILHNDLFILKQTAQKNAHSLAAVQKELDVRQKELGFLKAEYKRNKLSVEKEANLLDHIANLESQIEQIEALKTREEESVEEMEFEVEEMEEEVIEKEEIASTMSRLAVIMNQTHIELKAISIRSSRDSDNINKLKDDGKNWKYTVINFDLFNADQTLLADANFEWRIINMDTGEPISYIESNYVYPNADDSKGLAFTYDGYAQEVVFINTEKKEGANYELKLFCIEDNQAYVVNGSSRPIIFDGKAID